MSSTGKNTELNDAVTRLAHALQEFSLGKGELNQLQKLRDEVVRHILNVPGIFLITPSGQAIWTRLSTTGQDRDTAEGIAADLPKFLRIGGGPRDYLEFIDDTFTVFLEGKELPPLKALAYAVLKILYVWRGSYVTMDQLVEYIGDEGFISGRCREKLPRIEKNGAGEKRVDRAITTLHKHFPGLIKGNRNGRIISRL